MYRTLKSLSFIIFLLLTSCATSKRDIAEKFPELKDANIKVIRVPDRFEGNTLIEAHRIFVFENPSILKRRN